MKFKKGISVFLASFFLLSHSPVSGFEFEGNGIAPCALITIPKSGSHMLIKAIHLLTGGISVWHTRFPSFYCIPPQDGFLYTHLCLSPQLERDYAQLPQLQKIVNIRDLRDVCVSIIPQIEKAPWPGMTEEERLQFLSFSYDEKLLFIINYEYDVEEVAKKAPNSLQVSVSKVAEQAVKMVSDPRNLVCRYEDFVGVMGGGTQEAQLAELEKIAQFLRIPVSQVDLAVVASQLYGNEVNPFGKEGFKHYRSTFYQGKIGSWRTAFNDEHKVAFKAKLGSALIALGYEKDDQW